MDRPSRPRRPPRVRPTRPWVRFTEVAARCLITVGGIGTILAVALIFVFLCWVVVPLFRDTALEPRGELAAAAARPLHVTVDAHGGLLGTLLADGRYEVRALASGEVLERGSLFETAPTTWSIGTDGHGVVAGFADGTLRFGDFGFETRFPRAADLPAELRRLAPGETRVWEQGLLAGLPGGLLRQQRFRWEERGSLRVPGGAGAARLAHVPGDGHDWFAVWTEAGRLAWLERTETTDFVTGAVTVAVRERLSDYTLPVRRGPPDHLRVLAGGKTVLLLWDDGRLERLDARDPAHLRAAESLDLLPEEGVTVRSLGTLIGDRTLLVGDSAGGLHGWFLVRPPDATTSDGAHLVRAHAYPTGGAVPLALAPSARSRLFGVGAADGSIRLMHATSARCVATLGVEPSVPIERLILHAKEDGVTALTSDGRLRTWDLDPGHPGAAAATFFLPQWYEGYPRPTHAWQAEGATDDFEPKLGFLPLVFGTVKATLYSMLFAVPTALLAALFTSEFLDRRLRAPIKSAIELMASLPSVVLGFLAALVVAPWAQRVVPATLALGVTLPGALLLGAYLWQLLPQRHAITLSGWPRLACMALALPVAVAGAALVGPGLESLFFAGDLELWLDGQVGAAAPGWALLLLPACAVVVLVAWNRLLAPDFRQRSAGWDRRRSARFDLLRFAGGLALTLLLAWAVGRVLQAADLDPRGGLVDTYVQRNALVVGLFMGFAIIPIIYTLAEDALSSVPNHLRLASLGAGATPWQTAVRVVVPTATSGLFSAVMIGLGRAVGETMIVLMATGNTPVMSWNVFEGFRTLSANIAVELPEAVRGGTHYRTLFLAALVLFGITFLLNTLAELVRSRFRRRSARL